MKTAILKINCPDQKGIVFNVSRFIFVRGGNIINSQQHCEELDQRFFMRVLFDRGDMKVSTQELRRDLAGLAEGFSAEAHLQCSEDRRKIAVMVSKYDHCLYDLLLRERYGELAADIAVVVSNHTDLEHVAASFKVPFVYIPVEKDCKAAAEARAQEVFRQHHIDFVVLARYMQILSAEFIESWPNRIINIHHGFLPAFKGSRPYHQAYERGVKLIGATSHYATADLDDGPVIEQETIRVSHSHSVSDMLALGREIERNVLAKAVRAHSDDRIMVYKKRTIVFD